MNGKRPTRSKYLTLTIIAVIAAVIGIAGYFAESRPELGDRFYWRNTGGAVMFEHKAHFEMAEACEHCHHEQLSSDRRNSCSECHADEFTEHDFNHEDLKTIRAHQCGDCHLVDESIPAQSCRNCHPSAQEGELGVVTCAECHDADYTKDLMTHDEIQSIEGHSCEICHVTRSASAAYHHQCDRCHIVSNPELFTTDKGGTKCESCHLR